MMSVNARSMGNFSVKDWQRYRCNCRVRCLCVTTTLLSNENALGAGSLNDQFEMMECNAIFVQC